MNDAPTMFQGQKIAYLSKLPVLKKRKANQVIAAANGFLGLQIKNRQGGKAGTFLYHPNGSVIVLDPGLGEVAGAAQQWWTGDYNPETVYLRGWVAQVDPEDGETYGIFPGTWICNLDNTTSANPPIHPLEDGYDGTHWRLLSAWPHLDDTRCDEAGDPLEYFVDGQPAPEEE